MPTPITFNEDELLGPLDFNEEDEEMEEEPRTTFGMKVIPKKTKKKDTLQDLLDEAVDETRRLERERTEREENRRRELEQARRREEEERRKREESKRRREEKRKKHGSTHQRDVRQRKRARQDHRQYHRYRSPTPPPSPPAYFHQMVAAEMADRIIQRNPQYLMAPGRVQDRRGGMRAATRPEERRRERGERR